MIILLTGASHAGKTALSQKLLEKYKYPYLSIDHLKMGLIRSGNTKLTPMSDDADLTAYLWPIVREMIKTAIENKQNLIVEGCYIPFDFEKDFEKSFRRYKNKHTGFDLKQRLTGALLRKGYSYDLIQEKIGEMTDETTAFDDET